MKRVRVRVQPHPYDVVVGEGALGSKHLRAVLGSSSSHGVVVSSREVMKRHGATLLAVLPEAGFDVRAVIELPDGEKAKTVKEWERSLNAMVRTRLDRSGFLIGFGGGTIGDAAGFAAATFMRGVRAIQIPTTLLSMVDSSVGGKTGLNLAAGKNLVGSFHQPSLVLADLRFLKTLPERERRSGVYEILKCALLRSEPLLRLLERTAGLKTATSREVAEAIHSAVRIKARIVESDERESGDRALLNLGHALGHALEAATAYRRFTHGEAIGYGMEFVADLGEALELTPPPVATRIRKAVGAIGPRRTVPRAAVARAGVALLGDKKRRGLKIREILIRDIARPEFRDLEATALKQLAEAWLRAGDGPHRPSGRSPFLSS